jgi:hypothetical protein
MKQEKSEPKLINRMSWQQVDVLMIHLIRRMSVFLQARGRLEPHHLYLDSEINHRITWHCVLNYYETHGQLPVKEVLEGYVATYLKNTDQAMVEKIDKDNETFFDLAFNVVDISAWTDDDGLKHLRTFLGERAIIDPLKAEIDALAGQTIPEDLLGFIRGLSNKMDSVLTASGNPVSDLILDTTHIPDAFSGHKPCGVAFIDDLLGKGRGPANGSVGAILGVLKSFKSTLARQLSISVLRRELAEQYERAKKGEVYVPKEVYLIGYEQSRAEMLALTYSYAAKICDKHIHLEQADWLTKLSTSAIPESMHEYERGMPSPNHQPEGELERFQRHVLPLGKLWHLVDMSGSTVAKVGNGYLDEIVAYIDRKQCERQHPIGWIIIDYAALMIRRFLRAKGAQEDRLREHYVASIADDCRFALVNRYRCNVMILHQFNAETNRKGSSHRASHASSAGGGMFAENLSYCLNLTKDEGRNLSILRASAIRHEAVSDDAIILSHNPFYQELTPVNEEYCIDPTTKHIIDKVAASIFHGDKFKDKDKPAKITGARVLG